jgi:3-oxoadipate enol-lactonase
MPMLHVNGTELYYEDTGGRDPAILFSHGLFWDTSLFEPQIAMLKSRYRCVAYDHRGQGRSADSGLRAIDMDTLFADAVALIDALDLTPVHVCGLSMGGFVAMRLAARRPDLVRSLLLLDTSADPEPRRNALKYRLCNRFARRFGGGVVDATMPIMFGRSALSDPARAAERDAWRRQLGSNRRSLWHAVNGVIERPSVYHELSRITAPTLVMVGEEDTVTVPAKAERIAAAIAGAKLVRIPRAGHIVTVEQPQAVTQAIGEFLQGLGCPATARGSTGHNDNVIAPQWQVLGAAAHGHGKKLETGTDCPGTGADAENDCNSKGGRETTP